MKTNKPWCKADPVPSDKINHGCICCSNVQTIAHMNMWIAVGFGEACVTKDGELIWEETMDSDEVWETRDAEEAALKDSDHDWRIIKHGPLHGETYQRQGPENWVLIESNKGFA